MSQESLDKLRNLPVWHVSLKPEDAKTITTREPVYFTPEAAALAALQMVARSSKPVDKIYVSRYIGSILSQEDADRVEKAILDGEGIPINEAIGIFGFALLNSQRVFEWSVEQVKALSLSQPKNESDNTSTEE